MFVSRSKKDQLCCRLTAMRRPGCTSCVKNSRKLQKNVAGRIANWRGSDRRGLVYGAPDLNEERRMTKTAIRFLTLAMFATATVAGPMVNVAKAAGGDTPAPSSDQGKDSKKKKNDKSSSIQDQKFLDSYRTAYATIYDRPDYTCAI